MVRAYVEALKQANIFRPNFTTLGGGRYDLIDEALKKTNGSTDADALATP